MNVIISWLNVYNHVLRDLLLKNLNAFFDIMVLDIYKKVIIYSPLPHSPPKKQTFIPFILFITKVRCDVLEVMLTPFALNTVVSSIFVGIYFCEFNEV